MGTGAARQILTLDVGTQIAAHLTLHAKLGEGGTALVFEAYHKRLQATVAIKVLRPQHSRNASAGLRLVREAHVCAQLEDPHVPRIYDVSTLPDGRPYVVMEKISGPTLEQYMRIGPLSVQAALRITRELLAALSAIHAAGIVHRDVKPTNVILQSSGGTLRSVRLMDFGIAEHIDAPPVRDSGPVPKQATVLGTPGYMAPEQATGRKVDGRTDLFAVGLLLYEMLTGELAFDDTELHSLVRAPVVRDLPDVRERQPDCPSSLAAWIAKVSARDPGQRFESADRALEALSMIDTAHPRRRNNYKRRLWSVLGAGVLWLVTSSASAPSPVESSAATRPPQRTASAPSEGRADDPPDPNPAHDRAPRDATPVSTSVADSRSSR